MKVKKTSFIAISLIIAMASLGFVFAGWTEKLNIAGTVQTGDFCVKFYEGYCINYDKPGTNDLKYYGYPERWPYDVGTTYCDVKEDKVTITLENVYPCYQTFVRFRIINCGTISAKLKDVTVTFEDPDGLKKFVEFGVDIEIRDPDGNWIYEAERVYPEKWKGAFPKTNATIDELETALETTINSALDEIGGKLPPNYELWFGMEGDEEGCFGFHIKQEVDGEIAPENATFKFTIEMTWVPFNDP